MEIHTKATMKMVNLQGMDNITGHQVVFSKVSLKTVSDQEKVYGRRMLAKVISMRVTGKLTKSKVLAFLLGLMAVYIEVIS